MNAWIIQSFEGIGNHVVSLMKHERDVVALINKKNAPRTPSRLQLQLHREVYFDFPGMAIQDEPQGMLTLFDVALTFPLVDTRGLLRRLEEGGHRAERPIIIPGFLRSLVLWEEEARALYDDLSRKKDVFNERYAAFYKKRLADNGMTATVSAVAVEVGKEGA